MLLHSKKIILGIGLLTLALLVAGLILGFYSITNMKEIVSRQFNQQQLELAQHAARQLENQFLNLTQDLATLNQSPSVQYLEKFSWANRIRITLSTMRDTGVLEIGRVDREGRRQMAVSTRGAEAISPGDFRNTPIFAWAAKPENKNQIFFEPATIDKKVPKRQIAKIFMPTYLESVDDAHPVPSHQFAGYIYLLLDRNELVTRMIKDIRSGKTGYVWAIDNQGNFISHPVEEFIGKNAFEIREQRGPKISFDQINRIQKEKMLQGESGASWYVSGWHRGVQGNIKKLIAYAPVRLLGPNHPPNWAVAVVAPVTEVDEVIHAAYTRQFIMQGFILVAILLGSLFILGSEKRYTRTLEMEIKNKTKDLRESEERYKNLVESAQDLIFSINQEGKFLSINNFGASFLSGALFEPNHPEGPDHHSELPRTFLGKSIFDFMSPEGSFDPNFIKNIWESGRGKSFEHSLQIGNRVVNLNTQFRVIKNETGAVQGILGISRDITEKKKIEQQMFNTEKLASLGLMSAGVAHEINNPLGVVLGYCGYMLEKLPPEDKFHQILKKIERQGEHCKKIVENLLSFSRYSDHTEDVSDVNANIETVLGVVQNNLLIKKVQLIKDLEPTLPKVKIDPIQLQQVILNLINNAVAAMPQGGILTVATEWAVGSERVKILVADTGTGIRAEHRSRIFDPFFTTKKVGEGTGLGLTVSYGIIKQYHGSIDLETATPEENPERHGTRFTVTLPVYRSKRTPKKAVAGNV
ncbi:MAG: cache domain-containing protein [Deltaproteobacteria bacterium]|nr:cache domain-containing protein [Deltaproteobacteria bacterium]